MEKLPEKYCIKDCEIVTEFATNRFGCLGVISEDYMHINQSEFPKFTCYRFLEEIQKGYTEITLEQFKKLVLNNNNMKKELKIIAPEGYEIDKENSTFEKIVFKVKEKQFPKTWGELGNISGYYVSSSGVVADIYDVYASDNNKNVVKTESQAKALLALSQLLYLRDEYNGDWKPDWIDCINIKYCIYCEENILTKGNYYHVQKVMVFKTEELRDKFYDNFQDLLETAKELL